MSGKTKDPSSASRRKRHLLKSRRILNHRTARILVCPSRKSFPKCAARPRVHGPEVAHAAGRQAGMDGLRRRNHVDFLETGLFFGGRQTQGPTFPADLPSPCPLVSRGCTAGSFRAGDGSELPTARKNRKHWLFACFRGKKNGGVDGT